MYKGKKILALITARGGSKGIKKKNIALLGNKPLVAWTIEAAKKSSYIDRLVLSSDNEEIIETARQFGCEIPFIRPIELAQDTSSSMDVILHALDQINQQFAYDYLLLLQPTSPFRNPSTIDNAIEFCIDNHYPMIVSVAQRKKSLNNTYFKDSDNKLRPVLGSFEYNTRRQDQPVVFEHNGAIYFSTIDFLRKVKTYNSPETRMFEMVGYENIDIDTEEDLLFARLLFDNNAL